MNKALKTIAWLIMAIPLAYLGLVWNKLPATIALHFNMEGTPDRFGSKKELLAMALLLTGVNAGVYLLLTNIYRIDPKKSAPENQSRLQRMAFAVSVFIAAILCLIIDTSIHPGGKFNARIIFAGTGLLFCFIGNYMHTIKPNYFAGIRLPWTLENETNWRKTHLLAGKLFFSGGLLLAILCLLLPLNIAIILFFSITAIITIIPVVYSYRLYQQQKKQYPD